MAKNANNEIAGLVIGTCLLSLLTACSGKESDGHHKNTNRLEKETIQGRYKVSFSALNSSISGMSTGTSHIVVDGDEIRVRVNIKDAPATTVHAQFIYSGTECPTAAHDTNDDGFVDAQEASKVYGSILVPLDADLQAQESGIDKFPMANQIGQYKYDQSGSYTHLLTDLQMPDPNDKDTIMKLMPGEELKLDGKVIVIHGVAQDSYLPGSVVGIGEVLEKDALPIACGIIHRIEDGDETVGEITDLGTGNL